MMKDCNVIDKAIIILIISVLALFLVLSYILVDENMTDKPLIDVGHVMEDSGASK